MGFNVLLEKRMKRYLLPIPALLCKKQNDYSESSPFLNTHTSENVEALGLELGSPLVSTHTYSPIITSLKAGRNIKTLYIYPIQASGIRQHYSTEEQSSLTL